MKVLSFRVLAVAVLLCSASAAAQDAPGRKGARELMLWAGGGTGVGHSSSTQMANAGLRIGKVLTSPHGGGLLRGNLEYAFDVTPLYLFFQDRPVVQPGGMVVTQRQTVYGGSVSPLIAKWNFTSGKRIVPFAGIEGSAIFTSKNVPAGDTSQVNFGSGVTSGLQFFRSNRRALSFSGHLMHISNASIGRHNPGINIALQFRLGYQWWR